MSKTTTLKFYVFGQAFGVMAESEEAARKVAREQWSEYFVGSFNDSPDAIAPDMGEIIMVIEPNKIVPFFA